MWQVSSEAYLIPCEVLEQAVSRLLMLHRTPASNSRIAQRSSYDSLSCAAGLEWLVPCGIYQDLGLLHIHIHISRQLCSQQPPHTPSQEPSVGGTRD